MDDVDPGAVEAQAVDELAPSVLGVHDHGVDALEQPPLGGELARARLAGEQVVGGQHERPCGSRCTSRTGVVSHWKCTTSASAATRR